MFGLRAPFASPARLVALALVCAASAATPVPPVHAADSTPMLPGGIPVQGPGTPADVAAILDILEKYESAWNTKDAKTLGSFFAEDADFSSIYGQKLKGRVVIADKHGVLFQGAHKESQQSRSPSEVTIRFVKPDVACVDSISEVTGVIMQSGTRSSMNRFLTSFVFVKNAAGVWEIVVFHNMAVPLAAPPPTTASE